jgi:hypothetical protein
MSHPENVALPVVYGPQADSDETLIRLWLDGRPPHTRRAYAGDITGLLRHARKAVSGRKWDQKSL